VQRLLDPLADLLVRDLVEELRDPVAEVAPHLRSTAFAAATIRSYWPREMCPAFSCCFARAFAFAACDLSMIG
jgi:hypothetical protein